MSQASRPMTYNQFLKEVNEFLHTRHTLSKPEQMRKRARLMYFAEKFGVAPEVRTMLTKKAAVLRHTFKSNQAHLPLRNEQEVKTAAEWLIKYRSRLLYPMRKTAALRIVNASSRWHVCLPEDFVQTLDRMASMGFGDWDQIQEQVQKRATYANNIGLTPWATRLLRLASELPREPGPEYQKQAVKLAYLIDEFDKAHGLTPKCGYMLPEDFLFGVTRSDIEKSLKQVWNVKTGNIYRREDLGFINVELLRDSLGKSTYTKIAIGPYLDYDQLNDWLQTATYEEAQLFDKVASLSNVKPYAQYAPSK